MRQIVFIPLALFLFAACGGTILIASGSPMPVYVQYVILWIPAVLTAMILGLAAKR